MMALGSLRVDFGKYPFLVRLKIAFSILLGQVTQFDGIRLALPDMVAPKQPIKDHKEVLQ